jgi:hypothetical protein
VKSFGQLPGKIVYREIEEISGITLDEYLNTFKFIGADGQPVGASSDLKIDTGTGHIQGD